MVAAAWAGRADVIVTDNLADFPSTALPASLARQSLDDFLLDLLDLRPRQVVDAVQVIAGRTGKHGPALTAEDIATYLSTRGTPLFSEQLLRALRRQAGAKSGLRQDGDPSALPCQCLASRG